MAEEKREPKPGGAAAPPPLWESGRLPPVPGESERAPMVGWYDPGMLLSTGLQAAISTVLGQHADARLREGLGEEPAVPESYAAEQELWLDYVSDVGDGWDSTYAVAYHLAQPTLKLGDTETRRGRVLVFGGDEVYPVASRAEYERRTLSPYQTALPVTEEPSPHVYAVPGNHDWYDSLVAFTRFFTARKWFGGWQTKQRRSYFALQLPHGWWLLGTDVQLASDIDDAQVKFFEGVRKQMGPEDRVILCNAEPHWIYQQRYSQFDEQRYNENNLEFLEKVLGRNISVFIAGDLHHYRRHEDADGRQKITAGGGGAFLHPTHGGDVSELADGFKLQKSFPSEDVSRKLTWRNLGFRRLNPSFSQLTAVLYLLVAWVLRPTDVPAEALAHPLKLLGAILIKSFTNPAAGLSVLGLFVAFWLITDTHSKSYKKWAAACHALAHLSALSFGAWSFRILSGTLLAPLVAKWLGGGDWFAFGTVSQMLVSAVGVGLAGVFVAPLIVGLYLLISLNLNGRHTNEAFSSLKIEDWKHFLRLHIDREGHLTIYPVGIERVPRQWKARQGEPTPSLLVPDDAQATPPTLIEAPINVGTARPPKG